MSEALSQLAEPRPAEVLQEYACLPYLLSSKIGLGHSSRAVAVAQQFPEELPVVFGAYEASREFISANLEFSGRQASYVDIAYDPDMDNLSFVAQNGRLLELIQQSGRLVVSDFLLQVGYLKEELEERGVEREIAGIYHTLDGYDAHGEKSLDYLDRCRKAAAYLDYLFLVEPKPFHRPPYRNYETLVIPTSPAIRAVTKSPEQVKAELGMEPDDNFIYVQGGMKGNSELRRLLISLNQLNLDDLKLLVVPYDMEYHPAIAENNQLVFVQRRMDGQNVIAAASGVISKPGMQILCESVAFRKPILFVNDEDPERQMKLVMIEEILGSDLPYLLDLNQGLTDQIQHWLGKASLISERFDHIPCDGAQEIANRIMDIQS